MRTLKHLWFWLATFALAFAGLLANAADPTPSSKETTMNPTNRTELATFGGGCFWCLEAVFEKLPGVKSVVSGYAGGQKENPTYKEVCHSDTGHAEVIQIEFDPSIISYEKLLDVFWIAHDPTTRNRQGADVGTQYRSIILYHSLEQLALAERSRSIANAPGYYEGRIVTELAQLKTFYPAEDYHQDYFRKNPSQPYCQAVIEPKLRKLMGKLPTAP